ncbi:IclR family transcriptional regulator [Iodobacter sp. HSC-16F04]|uniref:IclR family transcriptional regulator n=1 Tax=Iodobacter violaceini TaxID=3044271 RepID=A0ABX0KZK4_9NEIS|nr:IclR family transcriptional regulator [Iodobacter violacea]NHQ87907.1 IclR family transcriptional regulator [Iodobacter violacea]
MAENDRRQSVGSAEVAAQVLKALADLAPATSLTQLADSLQMPASKVHRYLQALITTGFAEQDSSSNHYALGPEALRVGLIALGKMDVLKVATPYLLNLRDQLNETVFFAVWGNKGATVVQVEQALRSISLITQVGSVLPAFKSATGLVFSAYLPELELKHLLQEAALARAEVQEINTLLAGIRSQGWHSIQGLLISGVDAISAPVFDARNQIIGVITVVGSSSSTLQPSAESELVKRLLAATQAISRRMGAV